MDSRSGHLVSDIEAVEVERRQFYEKLGGRAAELAALELAGRDSAMIDISGDSELAQFARANRETKLDRAARRRLQRQLAKVAL